MKRNKEVAALKEELTATTAGDGSGVALTTNDDLVAMMHDAGIEEEEDFQGTLAPVMLKATIAHSAGLFEFPDGDQLDYIEGVVVMYTTPTAWWENEEDEMPACCSLDGIRPDDKIENPINSDCPTCDYNQFKSAENGKGKKCSNKIRVFILVDGKKLPYMVSLSAMSINNWAKYITSLADSGLKFYSVVTRIELEKVVDGKMKYSVAHPKKIDIFEYYENNVEKVKAKFNQIAALKRMNAQKMKDIEITKDETDEVADPY